MCVCVCVCCVCVCPVTQRWRWCVCVSCPSGPLDLGRRGQPAYDGTTVNLVSTIARDSSLSLSLPLSVSLSLSLLHYLDNEVSFSLSLAGS